MLPTLSCYLEPQAKTDYFTGSPSLDSEAADCQGQTAVLLIHPETFTVPTSSTWLGIEDWHVLGKKNKEMGHGRSCVWKLKNSFLKGSISLKCAMVTPLASQTLGRRELLDPVRAGTPLALGYDISKDTYPF